MKETWVSYAARNRAEKYGTWFIFNYIICLLPVLITLCYTSTREPAASGYIAHAISVLFVCLYPHYLNDISESVPGGGLTKSLSLAYASFFLLLFPLLHYAEPVKLFVNTYFYLLLIFSIIPTMTLSVLLSRYTIEEKVARAEANHNQLQAAATAKHVRGMKESI